MVFSDLTIFWCLYLNRVIILDDSLFHDFEGLKLVIKLIVKTKKKLNVDYYLLPDNVYSSLVEVLKPIRDQLREYSTRKWLTGFIPDFDRGFYLKIDSILSRKDVIKVSDFIKGSGLDVDESYLVNLKNALSRGCLYAIKCTKRDKAKAMGLKELDLKLKELKVICFFHT